MAGGEVRALDRRLDETGARVGDDRKHFIPGQPDQPSNGAYNAAQPATYAAEYDTPDHYPSRLRFDLPVGRDPLADELSRTYRTANIYGMHWLLDVDNWYGYGRRGDGTGRPSFINTFQRGPMESVWVTVPQPSWEAFRCGGRNGFLDLFTGDNNYSRQWRYTNAPDADARAVRRCSGPTMGGPAEQGRADVTVNKAARLGDYLRYAMFDKYFMKPGCHRPGENPRQRLRQRPLPLSWYYAWGGAIDGGWAWRIGLQPRPQRLSEPDGRLGLGEHDAALKPASPNAARDWAIEPQAAIGVLPLAAIGRRGDCRRGHQQLEGPLRAPRRSARARSTAWPTTGSPSITIRPATTGSACRPGRCDGWRSTTT